LYGDGVRSNDAPLIENAVAILGKFDFYLANGAYSISFDENVLTDRFRLMQNDIKVKLSNDLENMFITFMVVEKRRKVNVKKFGQN